MFTAVKVALFFFTLYVCFVLFLIDVTAKSRNGRPDGIPPELLKCTLGPISRALHTVHTGVEIGSCAQ